MKVLLVFAHPEPRSLNGSLRDFSVRPPRGGGTHCSGVRPVTPCSGRHLWMQMTARAGRLARALTRRWIPSARMRTGCRARTSRSSRKKDDVGGRPDTAVSAVVVLDASDPQGLGRARLCVRLWIRVVGEHSDKRWGDRYGQGTLEGKRAMLIVTAGGWESHLRSAGRQWPH